MFTAHAVYRYQTKAVSLGWLRFIGVRRTGVILMKQEKAYCQTSCSIQIFVFDGNWDKEDG